MPTVKLFPRKQIHLFRHYLKRQPVSSEMVQDLCNIITLQWDVTVDEFRTLHGFPPHPDGGSAPNRGAMYVYQTDPGAQAGDDTLSNQELVDAWNDLVIAPLLPIQMGRPTQAQVEAAYPDLFADATAAATALSVQLDTIP